MRNLLTVAALTVVLMLPAWASEPGEPLDCADWVFLEPGLTCSYWYRYPCSTDDSPWCSPRGGRGYDNLERLYRFENELLLGPGRCPVTNNYLNRIKLLAFDGVNENTVAYIDERCPNDDYEDWVDLEGGGHTYFFSESGRLVLSRMLSRGCDPYDCGSGAGAYDTVYWVPVFEGFPTASEVLQTYEPTANQLGYAVPLRPEGMPAADYFDTYYGTLATVGDWSQAQALQCGYPASPPEVGDYLTVADTLPTPDSGQGYYYVTAVNYLGETRYGRKRANGALSGRDPAVLPVCAE